MGLVAVDMVWGGDGGGLGLSERGHGSKCQAHGGKNNLNPVVDMGKIRYHSHLWDHRSTGQLLTLIPRGHLEYCEVSGLRQLILV